MCPELEKYSYFSRNLKGQDVYYKSFKKCVISNKLRSSSFSTHKEIMLNVL